MSSTFIEWIRRGSLGVLLGIVATATSAQNLALPDLDPAIEVGSRAVRLTWDEVPISDGRGLFNLDYRAPGGWDFVNSSTVDIIGSFSLDCDYRLRVSKVAVDDGFGRDVEIVYEIWENVTNVGIPAGAGSITLTEPDTDYFFAPNIVPDLGIRVSGTINRQPDPLGTVGITVGGLCTSIAPVTEYFIASQNSVSSLADGLTLHVVGPIDLDNIPVPLPQSITDTTMVVTAPGRYEVMNGMYLDITDGSAAAADTVSWEASYVFNPQGVVVANLEAFEGYRVWRAELPRGGAPAGNLGELELMGEIQQCDSKFTFLLLDETKATATDIELVYDPVARTFEFNDRSVHNDFPYVYGVSTFDRGFLGSISNPENVTFEGNIASTTKIYPSRQARGGGAVYAVPNPYKRSSDWEEGDRRIVFANLPDACTIRIFTAAADHLATLQHGPGVAQSTSPTSRSWDLRTDAGRIVAPGIYIFQVEGTSGSFLQTGKVVIAR